MLAGKGLLLEEASRVPLIISLPGNIPPAHIDVPGKYFVGEH